jgi:release factor glutamine methyltransferase
MNSEYSEEYLRKCGDPEASISARYLIAHALNLFGSNALSNLNKIINKSITDRSPILLDEETTIKLSGLLNRRGKREPLQYILGEWDFHNLNSIEVCPPVLIPRPETEELVDHVIQHSENIIQHLKKTNIKRPLRILDIGTGSGAIGIALLKGLNHYNHHNHHEEDELPRSIVFGIEPNKIAYDLSVRNSIRFNVSNQYKCFHGTFNQFFNLSHHHHKNNNHKNRNDFDDEVHNHNIFNQKRYSFDPFHEKFDIIVSNPPYIPQVDMLSLQPEVLQYEDPGALCGGDDGLKIIKDIIKASPYLIHTSTIDDDDIITTKDDDIVSDISTLQNNHFMNQDMLKDLKLDTGGNVWFEIDTSHPDLLKQWVKPSNTRHERFGIVDDAEIGFKTHIKHILFHKDVFDRERFCSLHITEAPSSSFVIRS